MNMTLVAKDAQGKPIVRRDGRYLTSSVNCSASDVVQDSGECQCLNCGQVAGKAYEIQHLKGVR